jgi:5'-nucleotidase
MKKYIIGIDVDDVSGNLMTVWLDRYNNDYNDCLLTEDITDWNVASFTKPECARRMYRYIEDPSIYDDVKPIEGAVDGVRELRSAGHRVVFVTAANPLIHMRKLKWLRDNKFKPTEKDYVEILDKSLIYADYLLDDKYENVVNFKGKGYLFDAPWNKKFEYVNRIYNWKQFLETFQEGSSLWS